MTRRRCARARRSRAVHGGVTEGRDLARAAGPFSVVVVEDTGEGIDPETMARIFEVFLPRVTEEEYLPRRRVDAAAPTGGEETILLAEDEGSVREFVRTVLESEGYRVLEGVDGRDALEVEAGHDGAIDLLLTDVMMPRISGPELAGILQRKRHGVPVIYISGCVDAELQLEDKLANAAQLVPKPLDIDVLIRAIRSAIDGRGGSRS